MSFTVDIVGSPVVGDVLSADVMVSVPTGDGGGSGTGGGGGGISGGGGGPVSLAVARIVSPPWRFVVAYLDPANYANPPGASNRGGATIALLDRIATGRSLTYELDTPAQAQGVVDSDNPIVYLPTDASGGYDGQPGLAEGNRILYGFRREGGYDAAGNYAPWVIRFSGLIMQIEDDPAEDQPKSTFTAFDPWMLLYNRPVVNADGTLPGPNGISSTKVGTGTYDFPSNNAGDILLTLLKRTIHYHGPVWIDAGAMYGGTTHYGSSGASLGSTDPIDIVFQPGTSVGEAWKQICDTSVVDLALRPIYDPVNRPGYLAELAIHTILGQNRDSAVMAWDLPPRSLLTIDRVEDGTQRVNIAQFLTQGGYPVW